MTKKRETDPELEQLLRAYRDVQPTSDEKEKWRAAIAQEVRGSAPIVASAASPRSNLYRLVVRTAIQVGVAASLGFVIGAYFTERRSEQGQAMLFSQTEPNGMTSRPPATMDDERETVRVNLDGGDGR
ncbi:MAG: hypothetical protein JST04_08980 [Bdellovibrionales bacterium]|nr:hypothetical protein [Bdellovibrionales bacterium]